MEMRAKQEIELGQDITSPLFPLSFSLHDPFLSSHCSSCFSPLPPSPFPPLLSSSSRGRNIPHYHHHHHHAPLYCSPACSSSHSLILSSSSESLLPQSLPATSTSPLSSDLRTALRLLHSLPSFICPHLLRFNHGLLTNYHKLTLSPQFAAKIRQGATAMAAARKLRNGYNEDEEEEEVDDFLLEEAVLSLVITNAVEVQDEDGRSLGIAVYDPRFSWINHSCSPNACYRFSISPPNATSFGEDSISTLRIVPSVSVKEFDVCSCFDYPKGNRGCKNGPKIIVRSIKRIKKGEEVCVSYTDLLQSKAMRQSDLWFKYQFVCSCSRCSASPLTYVDRALEASILKNYQHFQEISASNLSFSSSCFDLNLYRDEAAKKLSDYMDEATSEFLSVGDPESCCKKLESMLNLGLQVEQLESEGGESRLNLKLHPFHHIALNAYTTLASAYRIHSSDVLAFHSEIDECQLKALDMSRTSAAYSLLLAGATHHLFCSESSLIVSAANFWSDAGESLLNLASSSVWNSFVKSGPPLSTILSHKCSKCSLVDIFDTKFILTQAQRANFENISSEFIDCVSNKTLKIWGFLVHGCSYLEIFEDPFDFRWLGHIRHPYAHADCDNKNSNSITEDSIFRRYGEWYTDERRTNIYEVGIHCLLYGGILADICYGQNSHLTTHVLNILYHVWTTM